MAQLRSPSPRSLPLSARGRDNAARNAARSAACNGEATVALAHTRSARRARAHARDSQRDTPPGGTRSGAGSCAERWGEKHSLLSEALCTKAGISQGPSEATTSLGPRPRHTPKSATVASRICTGSLASGCSLKAHRNGHGRTCLARTQVKRRFRQALLLRARMWTREVVDCSNIQLRLWWGHFWSLPLKARPDRLETSGAGFNNPSRERLKPPGVRGLSSNPRANIRLTVLRQATSGLPDRFSPETP